MLYLTGMSEHMRDGAERDRPREDVTVLSGGYVSCFV